MRSIYPVSYTHLDVYKRQQVVLAGEVKTKAYVDLQLIAREVIKKIGYTKGEYMFESNSVSYTHLVDRIH